MKKCVLALVLAVTAFPGVSTAEPGELVAKCVGREIPIQYDHGLRWDGDFSYSLTIGRKSDGTLFAEASTRAKTFAGSQIFYKRLGPHTALGLLKALSDQHLVSEDKVTGVDYFQIGSGNDAEDGSSLGLYVILGEEGKVLVKLVQDGWYLGRCLG